MGNVGARFIQGRMCKGNKDNISGYVDNRFIPFLFFIFFLSFLLSIVTINRNVTGVQC